MAKNNTLQSLSNHFLAQTHSSNLKLDVIMGTLLQQKKHTSSLKHVIHNLRGILVALLVKNFGETSAMGLSVIKHSSQLELEIEVRSH
jgi:hypothetical protein